MKMIYQKLPIVSRQEILASFGDFFFNFNEVKPERQRQKDIVLAFNETFLA
jgi:hypothetical protein